MLVGVQGINGKDNGATGIACSIAGFLALNKNRKTLILQFINKTPKSAEELLIGNRLRIEQSNFEDEDMGYSDEGMDALFRLVDGAKVMDSDFSANCTPMNEKVKHLFDVANISSDEHLDSYLLEKMEEGEDNIVNRLIASASGSFNNDDIGVYSNIVLLIDSANKYFSEKINSFCDYTIYCVPQGFPIKGVQVTDKKKEIIAVNNFDMESKFNIKSMKKAYSVKRIYPVVHNVGYKDALLSGTLLSFIRRNREAEKNDKNYYWKRSISDIITFLSGKEVEPEKISTKELQKTVEKKELQNIDDISYVEKDVTQKRKLFGRKPKKRIVGFQTDEAEMENNELEENVIEEQFVQAEKEQEQIVNKQFEDTNKSLNENMPEQNVVKKKKKKKNKAVVQDGKVDTTE